MRGSLSENHVLSADHDKFFLKKYRFDNAGRIAEIHAAKKFFAAGGVPVILSIITAAGETFFECDGAYYALFPFVPGRHLDRGHLPEKAIISLGQTLGRIHILGRQAKLVVNNRFKLEKTTEVLEKNRVIRAMISALEKPSDFDRLALANLELKQKLLQENQLTAESLGLASDHLIHGDFLEHNVFFDQADQFEWVFDFEKTNYSPRTFEIFCSLALIFLSGEAIDDELGNARKYLQAYASIYPITDDEIRRGLRLFFLKTIHGLWIESEHYLKNNNRVDQFLPEENRRLKYLAENLEKLINYLIQ